MTRSLTLVPPTPANVSELQPEAARRDAFVAEIAGQVAHMSLITCDLCIRMTALLKAHQAGDIAALRTQLDEFAAHYGAPHRGMH